MSEFTNYDPMQGLNQYQRDSGINPNMQYNQGYQQYPNQGYGQQQQGYQNQQYPYQMGDPMQMGPNGMGMPYEFRRRINKMNWEMIGNVDVATIARTNDIQSIEFLMGPVAFANITPDDSDNFGSRAGLHAFLILQLAVEYLIYKISTIPPPQPQFQPQQQQQPQISPQSAATYEARIDILMKDIKSRDLIINSLSDKLRDAEKMINTLKSKLNSDDRPVKQSKTRDKSLSQISIDSIDFPDTSAINNKKVKRGLTKELSQIGNEESGLVHPDTEYVDYNQNKMKIKSKPPKKKSKSRRNKSDSIDYDYSESEIIAPSKPKKKKKESKPSRGMFEADWGDSSGWN